MPCGYFCCAKCYNFKPSVTKKKGVHNLIEHPCNTPILHRAQAIEVPYLIRVPLIFSLLDSVQDSSYAHIRTLKHRQSSFRKHSLL